MDAPLAQCTREEQRAVVRFLWSEGSSGTKIHQRLLAQYGDNALSKTTVYEWIEKFKTGRTSVKSDHSTLFFSGALCQWSVHFYQQKITRVKTERTIRLADRDHVTQ